MADARISELTETTTLDDNDEFPTNDSGTTKRITWGSIKTLLGSVFAAASHEHSGADITSGTVADDRVASTIARDSEVSAAISALSSVYQPLDSDLTALAALSTTSFGRGLLELANAAALLSAAGAQAADSDLTDIAGLSPSNDDVLQRKSGAWANRTLTQLLADLAALGTTFQPLDSDLTSIAALTTTSFGRGLLELANQAALLAAAGAAAASHTHAAGDITSGSLALARGGTGASLSDPNADRIAFWDDSAGAFTWLTAGTGLTITDTTITAAGSSAADPVEEVFGTPTTAFEFESSSLTGLTGLGTPTAENADTTIPGHYYVAQAAAAGVSWKGRYVAATAPFTAIAKLTGFLGASQWNYIGLFVAEATPGAMGVVGVRYTHEPTIAHINFTGPTGSDAGGGDSGPPARSMGGPVWLAIVAETADDVDFYYSGNGYLYSQIGLDRNFAWTPGAVGIGVNCENGSWNVAGAFDFLRIWDSVKTFPGSNT